MESSSQEAETDETNGGLRWAKKPWNHLGSFTRDEAVRILREKMVSQKRRMLMKDCVRIIYYCQVQRSSGCKYEMSVCVPLKADEQIKIDDIGRHSCDVDAVRLRRRVLPQLEDFDKPIEKRIRRDAPEKSSSRKKRPAEEIYDEMEPESTYSMAMGSMLSQNALEEENSGSINIPSRPAAWTTVDVDIINMNKRPDANYRFFMNCTDQATSFSYAVALEDSSPESIGKAILDVMYVFGPPEEIQIDGYYINNQMISIIRSNFKKVIISSYAEKKNNHGQTVPRREAQIIKERLFAWLVEHDRSKWSQELKAMKFAHNSEWIDELNGTPIDLFYNREVRKDYTEGINAEQLLLDVKYEMCNA